MWAPGKGEDSYAYACDNFLDTVYRVAVHNTPTRADAEDVTQDVFEALITSGKTFREAEHMKAWLIRVTLNRCRTLWKRRRREAALPGQLPAPPQESGEVLAQVLALPPNYRNAIYLHYYEGYTAAEIGALTHRSVNTVLSWLARGRKALKDRMIGGFEDE